MIRSDYQSYLSNLKAALKANSLSYIELSEEELNAKLQLNNGWMLELDCERYGSGVTVLIQFKDLGLQKGYAVWLLMRAVESLTGKSFGKPTVANQVRFLEKEGEDLLRNLPMYEVEYSRLNESLF